jgi:hypothetical protein
MGLNRADIFGFGMIAGGILVSIIYAYGIIIPDWRQRMESDAYNAGLREGRRQSAPPFKDDQPN